MGTNYEHGPGCECADCRERYPRLTIYKVMFDAHRDVWHAYGRAVFVEAYREADALALALEQAAADYPGMRIDIYAIGPSTERARAEFLDRRQRIAEWTARAKTATAFRGLL